MDRALKSNTKRGKPTMTVRWRGRHVFDNLVANKLEGGLFGMIGNVYHVNTAGALYPGNDSNSGLSYEFPLLTITRALALCVAGRNDYILIHDYYQASGETWPIVVNKRQVHIFGVAQPNLPYPAIHGPDDTPAFILGSAGQYSEIGYLAIGGGDSFGGINIEFYTGGDMEGQVDGVWIHHNTFGYAWFGTPACGIQKMAGSIHPSHSVLIEENEFLGDLAGGLGKITGNAIDILGTTAARAIKNWTIRRNRFKGTYLAINLVRAYDAEISENQFVVPDGRNGEAVSLGASCTSALVVENKAVNGMLNTGYGFNPYRDQAANTVNHWGMNRRGNAIIEPVGI